MSRLSQYFTGVAAKRLSAVETDPSTSNQHELNGVAPLRAVLGDARQSPTTSFIYLGDDETETLNSIGFTTWYDSRENVPTRSAEYRLYFQSNEVMEEAKKILYREFV